MQHLLCVCLHLNAWMYTCMYVCMYVWSFCLSSPHRLAEQRKLFIHTYMSACNIYCMYVCIWMHGCTLVCMYVFECMDVSFLHEIVPVNCWIAHVDVGAGHVNFGAKAPGTFLELSLAHSLCMYICTYVCICAFFMYVCTYVCMYTSVSASKTAIFHFLHRLLMRSRMACICRLQLAMNIVHTCRTNRGFLPRSGRGMENHLARIHTYIHTHSHLRCHRLTRIHTYIHSAYLSNKSRFSSTERSRNGEFFPGWVKVPLHDLGHSMYLSMQVCMHASTHTNTHEQESVSSPFWLKFE
jgi:hypothetical protein